MQRVQRHCLLAAFHYDWLSHHSLNIYNSLLRVFCIGSNLHTTFDVASSEAICSYSQHPSVHIVRVPVLLWVHTRGDSVLALRRAVARALNSDLRK